jgi:acyl-coenzyme A synthetase/AMP-(fatty) acid ligase
VAGAGPGLGASGRVVAIDDDLRARLQQATVTDLSRLATGRGPDEGMRIATTSGTTGAKKHILKTRRMVNASIDSYDVALRPVAGDFTYVCAYSSTINGVYTDVIRALKFANPIRFVSSFSEIIALCRTARCYAFLLTRDAEKLAATCRDAALNLDMYYVDVTGSGVSPALEAALQAHVTSWVANVYSSNESSTIAYREQGRGDVYAAPSDVEVQIVDEAWRPVATGAVGRICARSDLVARSYLWDEALTERHFRDGWFMMSDLGRMPEPGKLLVIGRADDMLNVGGEKVAPYPIEERMKAVPGVSDAVLLALRNGSAAGMLCVVVEAEPGQETSALIKRVAAAVRRGPAFVVRVEAQFPRTATGKVRRDVLQARAEAPARQAELSPL